MSGSFGSRKVRNLRRRLARGWDRAVGRRPLHFLHISKAGGTAIKDIFEARTVAGSYRVQLHPHAFSLRDVPIGERVFFFLRDPTARFVSGFNSRLRQGRPRYFNPWTAEEEAAFRTFATPDALATALSSPDANTREAAEAAMRGIGHVRVPYSHWLGGVDYVLERREDILFVGFQESFEADVRRLGKVLGETQSFALPTGERAHRSPESLDQGLSPEGRKNIERWFAEDYRLLELCRSLAAAGAS